MRFPSFLFLFLFASGTLAQAYPARPVRVLVGFTPGGGTDIMARFLTPRLSEYLGQQFVVENRPGAATNVATEMVAKAAPDGYTLLFTTSALAINASLYKNLQYDALRDLAPVSVLAESPNLLAPAPAGTPREILATLADASMKAARSPELKPRLIEQGAEPIGSTPEEFARLLRDDIAKYAEAVKLSGAKPE